MNQDMRERYETLSAVVLRELAKSRGIKKTSRMKKDELIEVMLEKDAEEEKAAKAEEEKSPKKSAKAEEKKAAKKSTKTEEKKTPRKSTKTEEKKAPRKKAEAKPEEKLVAKAESKAESKVASKSDGKAEKKPASKSGAKGESKTATKAESKTVSRPDAKEKPQGRSHKKVESRGDKEEKQISKAHHVSQAPVEVDENKRRAEKQAMKDEKAQEEISQYKDAHLVTGILEVLAEGYGFIRSDNYMPGDNDVYVSPSQIRRFNMKTGDIISGKTRKNNPNDKFGALLFVESMNGENPDVASKRKNFEDLIPIFPDERIRLEYPGASPAMRIVDLFSPIGKGQRGMIVSQPKAGKTTLLKEVAKSVKSSQPNMHIIVLLIDERPEEVTDMKESIEGDNVEVIYSTFDELPEHHKRVSEMTIERAKRLVERGKDVMILLDSITRLARAYNLTVPPSGRTLSGGLDPAALHMPKRFFGAARNMRGGGSLTILATALVNTGSKMDDVVYEEFKGTGNMELILDRKMSEKRIFPAIDLTQSSTRRDDLLLSNEEKDAMEIVRRGLNSMRKDDATEQILNMLTHTRNNGDLVRLILRKHML